MKKITLNDIPQLLKDNNNFYLLTHKSPDGDTLGSALALCYALRSMGKNANVITESAIPSALKYLLCEYKDQEFKPEYILSIDVAAKQLFAENMGEYIDKIDLCIDHHGTNDIGAENVYVDASAAATSEIIYDIINLLSVEIDEKIAACLYTGISTDTGCFLYQNTTKKTHDIAAQLIDLCDFNKINRINFETKSKDMIELEKMVLNTIEFYHNDECAIITVTHDMLVKTNSVDEQLDYIVSIPRDIEGVKVGITIKEKENNLCKISVRTNDGVNASEICSRFGGGGHPGAGGCSIEGDINSVKEKLISAVNEVL